ncbi:hypothetical protein LJK88_00670 [Paenibacillus sp. P26]|nr:hypothetical protein LJK88_00670 [Paenibacillus sp. P26]
MKEWSQLELIFHRMKEISHQMADLELLDENDMNEFEKLQSVQATLRKQADELLSQVPKVELPQKLIEILKECLIREQEVMTRLSTLRTEFSNKIQEFRNAAMTKRYQVCVFANRRFFCRSAGNKEMLLNVWGASLLC